MRIHATQGFRGQVIDLDTGQPVPKVIWLDVDRGELEAYEVSPKGEYVFDVSGEDYLTYKARGRFKYVPTDPLELSPRKRIVMGAPQCAKCYSPLTLMGDDLCPPCRAKDRNQRNKLVAERITNPLEKRPCSHKGCSRDASWSVSDEVVVTPEVGLLTSRSIRTILPAGRKRVYYERGMTVGRRYYCSNHYLPPRILDARGEVIEVLEEAHGVRPS